MKKPLVFGIMATTIKIKITKKSTLRGAFAIRKNRKWGDKMPEELNLGKLVAEIVLENSTQQGADEALETLKSVEYTAKSIKPEITINTKNAETVIYIKDVLQQLGIKGKEANKILDECFSDVSALREYQQQLEIIAQKLENQRKLIAELEATSSKKPLFASDYTAIEKATKALDKEKIKLMELEAQFDKAYDAQDNFVQKQVAGYKKQETAATTKQVQLSSKLDNKQAGTDFAQSVNLASTSLSTLVTSNIGDFHTDILVILLLLHFI